MLLVADDIRWIKLANFSGQRLNNLLFKICCPMSAKLKDIVVQNGTCSMLDHKKLYHFIDWQHWPILARHTTDFCLPILLADKIGWCYWSCVMPYRTQGSYRSGKTGKSQGTWVVREQYFSWTSKDKSKIGATRCQIFRLKCIKFDFHWGSLQHSPRPPSCT